MSSSSSSSSSTLDDIFALLELATKLEGQSRIESATKYYEAVYLMRQYVSRLPQTEKNASTRTLLEDKVKHYEQVASKLIADDASMRGATFSPRSPVQREALLFDGSSTSSSPASIRPPASVPRALHFHQIDAKANQANSQLSRALDLDEKGQVALAIQAYTEAAKFYLEALKIAKDSGDSTTDDIASVLKRRAEQTMDRIEQLQRSKESKVSTSTTTIIPQHRVGNPRQVPSSSSSSLTKEEIAILKHSSLIASGLFLPWTDEDAKQILQETRVGSNTLYTDPDGYLPLSEKQKERFYKWARPSEIVEIRHQQGITRSVQKPVMVKCISPYTIKQQFVTDCSFIASLCICAAFERRFQKRLITSILHPQSEQGELLYNPSGKYMVKLWLNGVARRVVIDDLLPIDKYGHLLCSHSSDVKENYFELWVCLIEKAYMKLCGGYDFPGSNSGVDLFSLTGWIPERVLFAKDPLNVQDYETHPERAWERIFSASSYGDCLITISSHVQMTKDDAEKLGLVTGHAYAVLSVIETSKGVRLLQLKNPWGNKGWKGRYSQFDTVNWNDQSLRAEVGYNPDLARQYDDGIFWICWDDIMQYFQNFHLSWNPNPPLFRHRFTTHGFWSKDQGPSDDTFNVGENPQYVITVSDKAISQKAAIWILVSRHVTKQEQAGEEATEFLTVHLHQNNEKRERIWYPGKNGNCILTGAYTNSPQVLVRYDVRGPEDKYLSLVLSQYKKSRDLAFTLSCYSTEAFSVGTPRNDLEYQESVFSSWTVATAGGPVDSPSYLSNPNFAIAVPKGGTTLQLCVSTEPTIAANVIIVPVSNLGQKAEQAIGPPVLDSGRYRHGFLATPRTKVSEGAYALIISSYHSGQVGRFQIKFGSSQKIKISAIN